MNYTYTNRKRGETPAPKTEAAPEQTSLDALRAGTAAPTREQLGHRVDLPDAMREKMESAFGADLSAVRVFESQAVADAGANAMARGADIAFAPGMLDFSSYAGQALLGHEISHVVSQARGEVTGGGFLSDRALEARADREGAMAAAGQTVAMPTASLSPVSAAAAAGPMQADKEQTYREKEREAFDKSVMAKDEKEKAKYKKDYEKYRDKKVAKMRKNGADSTRIIEDNAETTDYLKQMQRSHDRNIGENAGPENHAQHLAELRSILDTVPDEELPRQTALQTGMVDAYTAAYHAGLGAGGEGAFIGQGAGLGGDLLGSMYARMMGVRDIQGKFNSSHDQAVSSIGMMADQSGVSGLLRRQHHKTYGTDPNDPSLANVLQQADTMRGFWTHAITPNAGGNDQAALKAPQIGQALRQDVSNNVVANQYNGFIVGSPGWDRNTLSDEVGARFLLNLTQTKSKRVLEQEAEAERIQAEIDAARANPPQPEQPEPDWSKFKKPGKPKISSKPLSETVDTYFDPWMEAQEAELYESFGFKPPTPASLAARDKNVAKVQLPQMIPQKPGAAEEPEPEEKPEKKKHRHHLHRHHHHKKKKTIPEDEEEDD